MLTTAFDAYLTTRSPGSKSLVHKYVHLKEPYNQNIKKQLTTKIFLHELLKSYKANYTRKGGGRGGCLASPSLIRIKQKKEMLLLIPENTGDRVFSVRKTKIPTEYREKDIRCFKN